MIGDTWGGFLTKPSRTARKVKEHKTKTKRDAAEKDAKAEVRKRDRYCRFPLCGCRRLKLRQEVSHVVHKGMGGNPAGDRSTAAEMVYLCTHRHQHGRVSRHAGTLRARYLTRRGFNGPIAWEVNLRWLDPSGSDAWREVARESSIGIFEPFTGWQYDVLKQLGEMEI